MADMSESMTQGKDKTDPALWMNPANVGWGQHSSPQSGLTKASAFLAERHTNL